MIKLYGTKLPVSLNKIRIGEKCPFCKENSKFTLKTDTLGSGLKNENISEVIISYTRDGCLQIIPIHCEIDGWERNTKPIVNEPRMVVPVKEDFNFEHVPDLIQKEINEALNYLSVDAINGFVSLCRRAVQAICDDLGAKGTSKVQKQIEDT